MSACPASFMNPYMTMTKENTFKSLCTDFCGVDIPYKKMHVLYPENLDNANLLNQYFYNCFC